MRFFTFLAVLLTALASYCQETGYYVTKSGQKVTATFEKRPTYTSTDLSVKPIGGSAYEKIALEGLSEFGVPNVYKMQRFEVDADFSTDPYTKVSPKQEPIFKKRSLFLEVLVEGDATLYVYEDNYYITYFYEVKSKNIPVTQLVNKDFMLPSGETGTNAKFRQQLYQDVRCEEDQVSDFVKKQYTRKDIIGVFERYNTCHGGASTKLEGSGKGVAVGFSAYAGYAMNKFTFTIDNASGSENTGNIAAGIEGELLLPSRRVALFARAEYTKVSSEVTFSLRSFGYRADLDSPYINAYLGPRYYVLASPSHKVYIDASAVLCVPSGTIDLYEKVGSNPEAKVLQIDLETSFGFNFGAGYVFNNRWGIEARYSTSQKQNNNIDLIYGEVSRVAVNLKYTIL